MSGLKGSRIDFLDLMQADFILFIREATDAVARGAGNRWHPATLVYVGRTHPLATALQE